MLILISMVAIACNRKGNTSTDGKNSTSEIEPTEVPKPTIGQELDKEAIPTQESGYAGVLEPTKEPEPTEVSSPNQEQKEQKPTEKPAPTKRPDTTAETDFFSKLIPSDKVYHSATAFNQGNYLFYKSGKLTSTVIAAKNLNTSKVMEITTIEDSFFNTSEFYLKGSDIYYHADGNIYRVGLDGNNKTRLFKGKATILGFHEDNVYALDRKAYNIRFS